RMRVLSVTAIRLVSAATICGQTPPSLTFPPGASVGVISQNTAPNSASFLTLQVSGAGSTGFSVTDGNYPGWCIDNPDSNVLEVAMAFPMISSYDRAASSLFPANPWPKISYVLNHKQNATFQDVQQAIWMLIFGNSAGHFPVTPAVTTMLSG